jgi:hypothetical protein
MNNFKIDGWQPRHWRDISDYSKDLGRCSADLINGIDSGPAAFAPDDVIALVGRLDIIARRLREIASDY